MFRTLISPAALGPNSRAGGGRRGEEVEKGSVELRRLGFVRFRRCRELLAPRDLWKEIV